MSSNLGKCENSSILTNPNGDSFSLQCDVGYYALSWVYDPAKQPASSFQECIDQCDDLCVAISGDDSSCKFFYTGDVFSISVTPSGWGAYKATGMSAIAEPVLGATFTATPVSVTTSTSGGVSTGSATTSSSSSVGPTSAPSTDDSADGGGGEGFSTGEKAGIGIGVGIAGLGVIIWLSSGSAIWKNTVDSTPS